MCLDLKYGKLGRLKAKPFAKFCTECRTVYENEFVKRAKNW